jgi:SAM-dependent methyltransferase
MDFAGDAAGRAVTAGSESAAHGSGPVALASRWGRRALMLPRVAALGVHAPRDTHRAWHEYWASVHTTGDTGEVLWDASTGSELAGYRDVAAEFFDTSLPLVDLGCGNGRFTRGLADLGSHAIGVDLADEAVRLGAAETGPDDRVQFLDADITAAVCGPRLSALFGECNVFVRGVLHVLTQPERDRTAGTIAALLGSRGRALIAETDFRGGTMAYLEHLGAGPGHIPPPLAKAIAMLPRPHHFGIPEATVTFPRADWEYLVERPTTILAVPTQGDATVPERIPGYLAVLAPRT